MKRHMKFSLGRSLVVVLTFTLASSTALAEGLVKDQRCKLGKELRALAKKDGEQKWEKVPAATEIKIKKPGAEWTRFVILPAGRAAKGSTAQLIEQCGAAAQSPAPPPAEPEPAPVEAVEPAAAAPAPAEAAAAPTDAAPAEAAPADVAPTDAAPADAPPTDAAPADAAPTDAAGDVRSATEDTVEPLAAVAEVPVATPAPVIPAASSTLPLVAVLDLRHAKGDGPLANALATVITSEIGARSDLRALSRNELQSVVMHKAEQALLGCESAKCASDVAKLVEADFVVAGGIERVEEAYVFSLTLFDPVSGTMRERVEATWRSDPDEIVLLVRPYVDRLFGGANAASFVGSLEILAPDGASIFIDGREQGAAPLPEKVNDLPIGVHTLEVVKSGFVTDKRDVVVMRGETTVARVELEEEPYYTQWWFWTAIGGSAAVAVAAGATIGTVALLAAAEPPPTTVTVKSALPNTLLPAAGQ